MMRIVSMTLKNPVLILTWGLPLTAVVASVLTLFITLAHPDGELPEQYHWEGFQLDRDFSLAERAARLHVNAVLNGFRSDGLCTVTLHVRGDSPQTLILLVSHATLPRLDQRVRLKRVSEADESSVGRDRESMYVGECRPAEDSHWRLELMDEGRAWAFRESVRGPLDGLTLDAVSGASDD